MESVQSPEEKQIQHTRLAIASRFLSGNGLEVGAGSRPFPVPANVRVTYGDIRDHQTLESYFNTTNVQSGDEIDAQTFADLEADRFDFVISAHLIEHLLDPVGSIIQALRVLKPNGVLILVVPDMRRTFDCDRPETTLDHVLQDYRDGGVSSMRQGYEEHLRYVHPQMTGEHHPEAEIQWQATESVRRWPEFDIHFHAWTRDGFERLLKAVAELSSFNIEAVEFVVNENIFVLRQSGMLLP
jgi:SAM-dependent methyltransferase